MRHEIEAAEFIRRHFEVDDRLAIVLVNKQARSVVQRIATAGRIASPEFQAWLHRQNRQRYEVYMSMNALREGARGRTKADIDLVRHVFLDIDQNGDRALREIRHRPDLPAPSAAMNTSPDKWQVIWRVRDFTKEQAEELQKALARDTGADAAATDCARVLRLPGFYNHKYDRPYLIRLEMSRASGRVYRPQDFPIFPELQRAAEVQAASRMISKRAPRRLSQSERDWAYAKRALARGDPEDFVIAAIASFRRYDKHSPQYYAEHTVRKAAQARGADLVRRQAEHDNRDR